MNLHLQGLKKGNEPVKKRFYRIMMLTLLLAFFSSGAWAQLKPKVVPHINTSGGGIMTASPPVDPPDIGGGGSVGCSTPVFTTNLSATTYNVTVNGTAPEFNVVATNATSYQWYKSTDGAPWVATATGTSFTPDVSVAGTFFYYVVATNSCGGSRSNMATVIVTAQVSALPTLPTKVSFGTGFGESVVDYMLPDNIIGIVVAINGAQGGNGSAICNAQGGLGALFTFHIPVNDACAPHTLMSGGTIRLIVGKPGSPTVEATGLLAAGGGGGSALLYKAPSSSDWMILVVAGGGGGASELNDLEGGDCSPRDGGNAQFTTNGGNGGNGGGNGGTNGNGGNGFLFESYGGGGAYTNGVTLGNQDATGKFGFPNGGSAAVANDYGYAPSTTTGGAGFGGGAAGYRGGGGGGGFSGGGGGTDFSGGGGGGSYVSSWVTIEDQELWHGSGEIDINTRIGVSGEPVSLVSSTLGGLQVVGCSATDINVANSGFNYSTSGATITLAQFNAAGGAINSGSCSIQTITYIDAIDATNSKTVNRTFTVTDINHNTASCTQVITIQNPAIAASITPATQTVCINTNPATISVDAFSQNRITIQWYSGDGPIFANATIIPGALSGSYPPPATSAEGLTYYFARITDECANVSIKSAKVTVVSTPPIITTDVTTTPYNITQNGISPILGVLASGSNLTYQWYSNTVNSNTDGTMIAGVTVSSFPPDVHTVRTSYYYAVVSGTCGFVNSKVATVIVTTGGIQPVAGTISGGGGSVCSGTNSTELKLNNYTGTIQWQSSPSQDNSNFVDIQNENNETYSAKNLTASTWYRAVVSSGGTSTPSTSVEVTVTPNATALPVTAGTSPQCINSTTTYTVSGSLLPGETGAWSSSDQTIATVDASGNVKAVGAGTCNIVYTVTGSCGVPAKASQPYTVTPNATALPVTAGTSPQCINSTTTYTVSGSLLPGETGAWSSSLPGVATVDASSGLVTAISAGTCNIIYTVTGSCGVPAKASQPYTVTPNASAGTVTAGTNPQCIGSTTTYTVSGVEVGGGTGGWSSDNTTVATVDASGVVTAKSAGIANMVYTVTDGCGGTAKASQPYIVTPNATALPVTAGTSPQCINSTTTYTVSGSLLPGETGAWSSDKTAVATVDASSGLVTAISAGTCNIIYTVTGSCGIPAKASQPYTVTPNASAGTVTAGTSPQCIGSTTTYSVAGAVLGGGGYGFWSSDDPAIATVDQTGSVTAIHAGTANIVYTVTNGCSGTAKASQPYKVTPNASAGTVTAGTSPQCIGSTTTYTVSGVELGGGTGGWSSDNTTVATVDASGVVTAKSAGIANIVYTVKDGCGGTATAYQPYTVTPNARAGTVSGETNPQCIGSSTPFTVSGTVLGGGTSAWSTDNSLVATVDASGMVKAVGAGTVNIIYTVTGGCGITPPASEPYTVTPNASAGTVTAGTSPQCIGSTTTYTVSGVELGGGTGGWSSDNTTVATVDASGVVTAKSAGIANIVYTVKDGCGGTAKASQPYTVTPNASAGTVSAGTSPQCIGSTTTYKVSGVELGGGTGTWRSSDPLVATVNASGLVTAVTAGQVDIIYSVTGGCNSPVSASQTYVVNPTTLITTSPSNVSIPALDNTSFTVIATGAGTLTYQWQVSTNSGSTFTDVTDNSIYLGSSGATLKLSGVNYTMNGYQYQCIVAGTCGSAMSTAATLTVTKRPTVITYTGDNDEQYSDVQTLTATLKDQETNSVLATKTVTFTLGNQSASSVTDASGLAKDTLNMYQAAGNYNVLSSFAGDDTYAASSDTDPFSIKKENAITDYTGPEFISVPCATCATTDVLLSASVIDTSALYPANDKYPGDIRKARVKFVNLDNNQDISGWLTPGLANAADTTSGIVTYNWTVALPTSGYDVHSIGVIVDNDYTGTSQSVLSVWRSSLTQFITGGGHLIPASSGGQYASDAGRKVNFGFNVKYNKTGKNLQGNMNIIFRRAGHVYQIKATSMTSLSINTQNPCSQKATFVSKANLTDITDENNPVSVYGGITLQTTLTDNGDPGKNDLIGITLLNGNTLIYSSNWVSTKTTEMLLNGGNVVVNSGVVCSKNIATRNEAVMVTEQITIPSAISVNAYPNPLRDQTSIVYSLPANMHIHLSVYDLLGKKVAQLQDASQGAGIHNVKFNAGNLAEGVYIYTLSALDDKGKLTVINGKLIIGR